MVHRYVTVPQGSGPQRLQSVGAREAGEQPRWRPRRGPRQGPPRTLPRTPSRTPSRTASKDTAAGGTVTCKSSRAAVTVGTRAPGGGDVGVGDQACSSCRVAGVQDAHGRPPRSPGTHVSWAIGGCVLFCLAIVQEGQGLPLDEGHDRLHSTSIHLLGTIRAAVLIQGKGVERFCENFIKPRFPRNKLIIIICPTPLEPHAADSLDDRFLQRPSGLSHSDKFPLCGPAPCLISKPCNKG